MHSVSDMKPKSSIMTPYQITWVLLFLPRMSYEKQWLILQHHTTPLVTNFEQFMKEQSLLFIPFSCSWQQLNRLHLVGILQEIQCREACSWGNPFKQGARWGFHSVVGEDYCSLGSPRRVLGYPEDGGRKLLRNVGN